MDLPVAVLTRPRDAVGPRRRGHGDRVAEARVVRELGDVDEHAVGNRLGAGVGVDDLAEGGGEFVGQWLSRHDVLLVVANEPASGPPLWPAIPADGSKGSGSEQAAFCE